MTAATATITHPRTLPEDSSLLVYGESIVRGFLSLRAASSERVEMHLSR